MKKVILSVSLMGAFLAFVGQLPIGTIAEHIQRQGIQDTAALAAFNLKGKSPALTAISNSAERWKLDPKMMYAICMIESGCGRNTRSGTSSARGIYQYIRSTWRSSCGAYRARVNPNASCNVNNAQMSAEVFAFDRKKREGLVNAIAKRSGLPVGVVHYINHFSPGMSRKLANKSLYNRSFASVMGNAVARANRMQGKTFGQVVAFFQNKYARYAGTAPANLANLATGQDIAPSISGYANQWWKSFSGQQVAQQQSAPQQRQVSQQYSARRPIPRRESGQTLAGQGNTERYGSLLDQVNTGAPSLGQAKATLTCDDVSGRTRLQWSCPSGTTVSKGSATGGATFDTRGAGAGSVTPYGESGARYTVQCLRGYEVYAEATCQSLIIESVGDSGDVVSTSSNEGSGVRDIIPSGVVMRIEYDRGIIIWATLGTRECQMSAGGARKRGKNGSMPLGELTQDTLVKLECNTVRGKAVKYKRIVVE